MDPTGSARLTRDELRRDRRAFIQAQHPDHGGDPAVFTAGLARFDRTLREADMHTPTSWSATPPRNGQAARVTVLRRPRGVQGWVRHAIASAVRPRRPARVH